MLKYINATSDREVIQLYDDPPGEHHRVLQAVVITAPGVGCEKVAYAAKGYLHPSNDGRAIIIDDNTLIVVSSHTIRPQPLVDFVLKEAAQHANA